MSQFIYDKGVRLSGTDLWFDARKKVNLNFISNACLSPVPRHERIIATPETLKFLESKTKNSIALSCPYNRPFTLGNLRIELIPSGHMLGSSQIVVEHNGKRIIYTGDIKLRYSSTSKYIEIRRCDILVLKCRYGISKYLFASDRDVMDSIYEFVRETLYFGYTPVIIIDPFGKTQDLILYLIEKKLRLSVHRSIMNVLKVYEHFGFNFENCSSININRLNERVVLVPPHVRGSSLLDKIDKKRVAAVMGWSVDIENEIKEIFDADFVFPLSNHAGYDELIQYVQIVNPEQIFLLGTYNMEFSRSLRNMGYDARPLDTPKQLKFF